LSVDQTTKLCIIGKLILDKGVANRFIKHAIAQVKLGRLSGQDEGVITEEPSGARVPVKITRKMMALAQYQAELKEIGSEEEDDLEVIDDAESETPEEPPSSSKEKGKQRATEDVQIETEPPAGQKRRRPAVDVFAGEYQLMRRSLPT
jgi:exosome complex protein LRP1